MTSERSSRTTVKCQNIFHKSSDMNRKYSDCCESVYFYILYICRQCFLFIPVSTGCLTFALLALHEMKSQLSNMFFSVCVLNFRGTYNIVGSIFDAIWDAARRQLLSMKSNCFLFHAQLLKSTREEKKSSREYRAREHRARELGFLI